MQNGMQNLSGPLRLRVQSRLRTRLRIAVSIAFLFRAYFKSENPRVRNFEQCQVVVFIADDLGFLGPGSPDLMTELCPPQDTA